MGQVYHVIDLFAGPGGLAEGFCACRDARGRRRFRIALSVEKEASAHRTLQLRAFLRQFDGGFPDEYYDWINSGGDMPIWSRLYPEQWLAARNEAQCLELGSESARDSLEQRLSELSSLAGDRTVVIGGPPCQAYSLAGRSRNRGKEDYRPEEDRRHFLYEEYIRILDDVNPAAFVMENVKGLVSSSVKGQKVADRILIDLASAGSKGGYLLLPLAQPAGLPGADLQPVMRDFLIRAEDHGVPQARHRIIILGIRKDLAPDDLASGLALSGFPAAEVKHVLRGMPQIRSGISRSADTWDDWSSLVADALERTARVAEGSDPYLARKSGNRLDAFLRRNRMLFRDDAGPSALPASCPQALSAWLQDDRIERLPNHDSRSHMESDLFRYAFASVFALAHGRSPKAADFPEELAPNHQNWGTGHFSDRFRVQLWSRPSTTVTSHISKDGHYFIHPDPLQCRSLTVREAARLQTFPDNYLFLGNRTQQYVQVGNAVPPFLARNIAGAVWNILERLQFGEQGGTRKREGADSAVA